MQLSYFEMNGAEVANSLAFDFPAKYVLDKTLALSLYCGDVTLIVMESDTSDARVRFEAEPEFFTRMRVERDSGLYGVIAEPAADDGSIQVATSGSVHVQNVHASSVQIVTNGREHPFVDESPIPDVTVIVRKPASCGLVVVTRGATNLECGEIVTTRSVILRARSDSKLYVQRVRCNELMAIGRHTATLTVDKAEVSEQRVAALELSTITVGESHAQPGLRHEECETNAKLNVTYV